MNLCLKTEEIRIVYNQFIDNSNKAKLISKLDNQIRGNDAEYNYKKLKELLFYYQNDLNNKIIIKLVEIKDSNVNVNFNVNNSNSNKSNNSLQHKQLID